MNRIGLLAAGVALGVGLIVLGVLRTNTPRSDSPHYLPAYQVPKLTYELVPMETSTQHEWKCLHGSDWFTQFDPTVPIAVEKIASMPRFIVNRVNSAVSVPSQTHRDLSLIDFRVTPPVIE